MIPDIEDSLIANEGERAVYIALRDQLPRDWTVRFHYPYCKLSGGYLRDGEADFIVVAPDRGVLYLEVKASYGYDCQHGVWYRLKRDGARERTTNPFEQVCRVKHEVTELVLCPRLGCSKSNFPGLFAHAVIYPRARIEGKIPASQEPQVIITYRDMDRLLERLENVFSAWGHPSRSNAFTAAVAGRVVDIIRDDASFIAVAAADSDDVNQRIEQLTRQQYETYCGLLSNRRALISGRAGSGKTMLALWTGHVFARDARVLFVCFNRSLATWLQRREEAVPNLEITTFHSLCAKVAAKAGLSWNPPADASDFWAYDAPNLLADGLDQFTASEKYDVILVDEGQDFHPNWWIPVELLLRQQSEGRLYIFYDPDQAIQNISDGSYPAIATTFRLDTNCRNTRLIARYCCRVVSAVARTHEGAPEGVPPVVEPPLATAELRAARARSIVKRWVEEGYKPSRIAVLSPYRAGGELSSLTSLLRENIAGTRFEANPENIDAWLDGKVFWASTIKSFKGLEADCLIITDVPGQESPIFSQRDLYVAVSRAKHHGVLIPTDDTAHRMARGFL